MAAARTALSTSSSDVAPCGLGWGAQKQLITVRPPWCLASHIPSRPGGPRARGTWLGADGEQRKMDHPAGGTCDRTPQRACRRERHAPGRGTSPRQSPSGRNVTPDLGAERIDGAEVEHWRHEALLEMRAMIDTAGAHRGTRRGALLHRTARRRTRRAHRVILIDAGPRTQNTTGGTSTPT